MNADEFGPPLDQPSPPWLDAAEAAWLLGKSKSQLNRDAAAGKIPAVFRFPGRNGARMFDQLLILGMLTPERIDQLERELKA